MADIFPRFDHVLTMCSHVCEHAHKGVNTWLVEDSRVMLGVLAKYFEDVSVLRRLLFAVVFLSPELPLFWGVVLEFTTAGRVSKLSVTHDQVKAIVENMQALNSAAFDTDQSLQREMIFLSIPGKKPLGYVLISNLTLCEKCGSALHLRKDRNTLVTIYDARLGTIPGTHFHKTKITVARLYNIMVTIPLKVMLCSTLDGNLWNTSLPRGTLFFH